MQKNTRIRFNPITKEIEIEGSETFVKSYFKKLQGMMTVSSICALKIVCWDKDIEITAGKG